jgi:uncharacterized protein (DUF1499 family)
VRKLTIAVGVLAALLALAVGAGQLGAYTGAPPADLGVRDGRLKAPSATPNSVSSQTDLWPGHPQAAYARIEPLPLRGDGPATLQRLASVVQAMPGARIVEQRPDYLRVEFTTKWMKFVDDAEFWFDPGAEVVQLRSASRLGEGDLGVNRERIEQIRARLAAS